MTRNILGLLIFLLNFGCSWATAQDYTYNIQQYDMSDGLLERHVNTIYEDDHGFIWIGFEGGIQRYDGHEFKTWTKHNAHPDLEHISAFGLDDDGWLWIYNNVKKTVVLMNAQTEEFNSIHEHFGIKNPFSNTNVFNHESLSLFKDTKGRLVFIFSQPNRIVYYSNNNFQTVPLKSIDGDRLLLHFVDSQNNLWIESNNSLKTLIKVNPKGQTLMKHVNSAYLLSRFYETPEHIIYNTFDVNAKNTIRIHKLDNSIQNVRLEDNSILYYQNDLTWKLDKEKWDIWINDSLEPVLTISKKHFRLNLFDFTNVIYEDSRHRLWMGGAWGLSRIFVRPNKFKRYIHFNNNANKPFQNTIRGIYADSEDTYAVASFKGLAKIPKKNPSDWKFIDHTTRYLEGVNSFYGGSALQKINSNLFLIGIDDEIRIVDTSGSLVKRIYLSEELKDSTAKKTRSNLWSSFQSKDSSTYVGTSFGLLRLSTDYSLSFVGIGNKQGQTNSIYHICSGKDNTLWLSTEKGLYQYDPNTNKVIGKYGETEKSQHFLPANTFYYSHIDTDDTHWLGTKEGLIRWNSETTEYQKITQHHGLSDNTIYSIFEDKNKHLWLATNYGINRYSIETKEVSIFHENDGICNEEFNRSSAFQGDDGTIYFGGVNGITSFHPDDFNLHSEGDFKIQITNFELFNNETKALENKIAQLKEENSIWLADAKQYFKLAFAIPNLDNQLNVQYAWRILELDENWKHQKENNLLLASLPYGKFTLQIKGQTENGQWSEIRNIALKVDAPFYLKSGFFFSLFLVAFLLVVLFFKRRNYLLLKKQQELKAAIDKATAEIVADKEIIEVQAAELVKMDNIKSRFFANITHELKTPITLILSPISKLLQSPELKATLSKQLSTVQKSAKELLQLVNSYLDLSKMENGKLEVIEEPIPLLPFVRLIIANFESLAEQNGLLLNFEYTSNPNLIIKSDKGKLETILKNLISNALKYTPSGKEVSIRISEHKTTLAISVSDTGMGIHPNDLPFIFDRFYQSQQPDAPIMGGTGIGLALSQELAHLLNGSISIQSEYGSGADFILEIPKKEVLEINPTVLEASSTITKQIDQPTVLDPDKQTILLVEDNYDLRNFIQSILIENYNVLTARNGKVALERLQDEQTALPHVIISDIMMPEMDGYQLLEILKSKEQYLSIPVIMLTAKTALDDKLKALRMGVDDYLLKPFEEAELLVRIKNLLRHSEKRKLVTISVELQKRNSIEELAWLQKLEHYILENLEQSNLNVLHLAKEFAMSESSFLRHVKKLTGLTPIKYLQEVKLNHAKNALENGKVSNINELANLAGYQDPKSFSRSFKNRFGKNPSQYLTQ